MAIGIPSVIDTGVSTGTNAVITLTVPAGGVPAGAQINILFGTSTTGLSISTMEDSRGNIYTLEESNDNHPNDNLSIYHIRSEDVTALLENDTITITLSATASRRLWVGWYTEGLNPAGTPNQHSPFAIGLSSTPTSADITTTVNDTIMFGLLDYHTGAGARTVSEDSNFTTIAQSGLSSNYQVHAAYRIVSATETQNYSPTLSGSAQNFCGIAAYAGAVAGPSTPYPPALFKQTARTPTRKRM